MGKRTDICPKKVHLYFLPIKTRVPLKFGSETLTQVTCARVCMEVKNSIGQNARGWGETPLSVQWVWPSSLTFVERENALKSFSILLSQAWASFWCSGHPVEIGYAFEKKKLPHLLNKFNHQRVNTEPMPWLAALVCCSAFDISLHDAYGILHQCPVYKTYNSKWMNADLSQFFTPEEDSSISFQNKYPEDFFSLPPPNFLPAWHLVGGVDPIHPSDLDGTEPDDGYPLLLQDWVKQDGLKCLKIKLRGTDQEWDYERLVKIGQIGIQEKVEWLTTDFNCTVENPEYVNYILDRLLLEHPRIYNMILYVEQPFPYDLENNRIDVHSVSARKPLIMDESAHNWHLTKLGRLLGWTGVALKTCKTQTGALLTLSWAKAHGMAIMVQDLTNPRLAQIPHVLLASYAGTIMGVETNAMQFYPNASKPEATVHPGLYRRQNGKLNLSSLGGPGFGYRLGEIQRKLPECEAVYP